MSTQIDFAALKRAGQALVRDHWMKLAAGGAYYGLVLRRPLPPPRSRYADFLIPKTPLLPPPPRAEEKDGKSKGGKSGLSYWQMIKETISRFSEDNCLRLAAALAYYVTLSLAPLLIIVIGVAGLIWGENAARGQLVNQIQSLVGDRGAEMIQTIIKNAGQHGKSIWAVVLGSITLLLGATGVFLQLQDALNTVWGVKPKKGGGIGAFIWNRLLSLAMVLGLGFLLLVSLVLDAALTAMNTFFKDMVPGAGILWQVLGVVASFLVITLLFAMIFKYLPDVQIQWRDVWVGAVVTGLLFTVGKFLIGLYLGHSSVASAYGAAGSLVILLIWLYYSSILVLLGAEFTQVYACATKSPLKPKHYAMPVRPSWAGTKQPIAASC